jgi:hypothetical protein
MVLRRNAIATYSYSLFFWIVERLYTIRHNFLWSRVRGPCLSLETPKVPGQSRPDLSTVILILLMVTFLP